MLEVSEAKEFMSMKQRVNEGIPVFKRRVDKIIENESNFFVLFEGKSENMFSGNITV
jgi:hypothetical protein